MGKRYLLTVVQWLPHQREREATGERVDGIGCRAVESGGP